MHISVLGFKSLYSAIHQLYRQKPDFFIYNPIQDGKLYRYKWGGIRPGLL